MKKILSLLLVVVLALSMVACGNTNTPDTTPSTTPSTAPSTEPATEPSTEPSTDGTEPATGNVVYMLTLAMGENFDSMKTLSIYDDDMGGCFIDFNGDVRKVATLDASVLADITKALADSGLMALAGANENGDGETIASLSVIYPDWTSVDVNYYGVEIPEAFTTAYNAFIAYMETLLADVPVYVPQAQVMEGVDEALLTELLAIVNNANIANLDQMMITPIDVTDAETFTWSAGLSSAEGITAGANCSSMMMTTAYSLIAVNAADTAAVAADFQAHIDWLKWICVQPSNAVIATKGNLVACLLATDAMYTGTLNAMTSNGWTVVTELTNPNM